MWKKEKGMIVFSFIDHKPPHQSIDIFVDEPFPFNEIYKKSVPIKVNGIKIPTIGIAHLKNLKLKDIEIYEHLEHYVKKTTHTHRMQLLTQMYNWARYLEKKALFLLHNFKIKSDPILH